MKPNTDTLTERNKPLDWLVMYSNSGDISILDDLEIKKKESLKTGIHDYFVPLDVMRHIVDDKAIERKRLIAGNYIFLQATNEDILRLRQEPPFDATLRFLHPDSSPTGCIYIPDEQVAMLRMTVERLEGEAEYFVPSKKVLMIGDTVCILNGKYAGIKGILESVKGHEGGRIIVPLGDVLAVSTPKVPVDDIQLLEFAKVSDSQSGSYTSRAYKKVRVLTSDSEHLLAEKQREGALSEESEKEARQLILRFSQLQLAGKIRIMHAEAICNLLTALGETESEQFQKFKNILP
ncbi:MAG: hypothetical protein J6Y59_01695 [Bacteroidaceae bacterium]|nr:hypothetical protein [Bacteroidaceae bacterium]